MIDREKVIKGLEAMREFFGFGLPSQSPVFEAYQRILTDTLALLKEQEAVEPFHRCIDKHFSLIEDSNFDYCPYCGKPITWAKQEGRAK